MKILKIIGCWFLLLIIFIIADWVDTLCVSRWDYSIVCIAGLLYWVALENILGK